MIFPELFLIGLALIWLVFAVIQDIKTREVADWLNFSLIMFALGFRFFYSLFNSQWWFLIQGIIGLGVFIVLGNLLYYCRIFAGGDAKLLIALGTVLPLSNSFKGDLLIFGLFLFLFLLCGALYGIFYSFVLISSDVGKFKKNFKGMFKKNKKYIYLSLVLAIVIAILGMWIKLFIALALIIFILPYLFIMAKTVEEIFMIKSLSVKDLREGDWLYEDLKIGKRIIKKDFEGLSKKDIDFIRKNYRKNVVIKEGIPFVPVFFIAFVLFLLLRNSSWHFIVNFFGG